ncbi:MAG: hypothetical protein GQ564_09990 [Bacteroidales bacterium]|nr:hypothetical protein [Bacteroidales bacterium]
MFHKLLICKLICIIYCDGTLPKKTKELITIAIGAVTNCKSCMQ